MKKPISELTLDGMVRRVRRCAEQPLEDLLELAVHALAYDISINPRLLDEMIKHPDMPMEVLDYFVEMGWKRAVLDSPVYPEWKKLALKLELGEL